MKYRGTIVKMGSKLQIPVLYNLPVGDEEVNMNKIKSGGISV